MKQRNVDWCKIYHHIGRYSTFYDYVDSYLNSFSAHLVNTWKEGSKCQQFPHWYQHHQEEQESQAAQVKAVKKGESVEKANVSSPTWKRSALAKLSFPLPAFLTTSVCVFLISVNNLKLSLIFSSLYFIMPLLYDRVQKSDNFLISSHSLSSLSLLSQKALIV